MGLDCPRRSARCLVARLGHRRRQQRRHDGRAGAGRGRQRAQAASRRRRAVRRARRPAGEPAGHAQRPRSERRRADDRPRLGHCPAGRLRHGRRHQQPAGSRGAGCPRRHRHGDVAVRRHRWNAVRGIELRACDSDPDGLRRQRQHRAGVVRRWRVHARLARAAGAAWPLGERRCAARLGRPGGRPDLRRRGCQPRRNRQHCLDSRWHRAVSASRSLPARRQHRGNGARRRHPRALHREGPDRRDQCDALPDDRALRSVGHRGRAPRHRSVEVHQRGRRLIPHPVGKDGQRGWHHHHGRQRRRILHIPCSLCGQLLRQLHRAGRPDRGDRPRPHPCARARRPAAQRLADHRVRATQGRRHD